MYVLCMYVCMCVYVCMYVCIMYVYVLLCMYVCVCMCVCMYACIYIYKYVCVYVCMYNVCICVFMYVCMNVCVYVCRFRNVVLRYRTPRLHRFLSSHWLSFRFLSFMALFIPFIQFFFGLPRAPFCFGIQFNAILDNLPSSIL